MIFEPFAPYLASEYSIKYAVNDWERAGAARLRRQVFCDEQRIFEGHDRDEIDAIATPIVAVSLMGICSDDVVGTVRIHQAEPGIWWGSRLAVTPDYRRVGALGVSLIKLAVSSAHARGCQQFFAHVQAQNVMLFQKLHWTTLDVMEFHGRPHHLMEADLDFYPPFAAPETGFLALRKAA
jgi:putative N-acetyltransferase (TIGR04045 family)